MIKPTESDQGWFINVFFKGLDTSGSFSTVFHMGENFCDYLFTFPRMKLFWKGVYS